MITPLLKTHQWLAISLRVKPAVLITAFQDPASFCPHELLDVIIYFSYTCLLAMLHSIQPCFCLRVFALAVSQMEHSFPRYLPGLFPHCLRVFAQILSPSPASTPYFLFLMYYVSPFIIVCNCIYFKFLIVYVPLLECKLPKDIIF